MQLALEHFFDRGTIARGMRYVRDGRVAGLSELASDGQLEARVAGSGRETYGLRLRLGFDGAGRLKRLEGKCSCPVGQRCKHMVAALIALQVRVIQGQSALPGGDTPVAVAPARPLPHPVTHWLEALAAATEKSAQPPAEYPPAVRDRLVYVLSVGSGRAAVAAMKATVQANGRVSDRATRYDVERLRRQENRPQFVLRRDLEILRDLEAAGVAANGSGLSDHVYRPRYLPDGPPDLLAVLRRIAATGRGRWQDRDGPFLIDAGARHASFRWQTLPGGAQQLLLADSETGETLVPLPLAQPAWLNPATGTFGPLDSDIDAAQWHILLRAPQIPAEIAAEVSARLTGLGAHHIPAPKAVGIEVRQGRNPVPVLRLFGMRGQVQPSDPWRRTKVAVVLPALRVAFDYGGQVAPARHADPLRFREGETVVTLRRDAAAEAAALTELRGCGALPPEAVESHGFGRQAEAQDRVFVDGAWDAERGEMSQATRPALRFLGERVPALRAAGWRVEVDPSWPCPLAEDPVQLAVHVGGGEGGLFDFGLTVTVGSEVADLAPLVAEILAGLPNGLTDDEIDGPGFTALVAATPCYLPLPGGRHARVHPGPLADLLRVLLRNLGLMTRVHPAEAGQIFELAHALEGCGIPFQGSAALMELGRRLSALTAPEAICPPAALRATLRPYQAVGYGWLCALSDSGFGGLLADDMGLGKTLQTLALLAKCHLEDGATRPSLLIVPTSLARAWARQAAEFVPGLKVLVLQGNARKALFGRIDAAHLVISTYPLLHRDHDVLLTRDWELAILDEAQAVKNPAATASKRIREIRARLRLALTGTPMENTLTDLWTLFDWLVPGLLGDRKTFRADVATPIEKDGSARAQAWLNRRVRPFLLRRTKDEVALDLPEKTEITELVPLGAKQQALYEAVRMAMDARVRDAIAARGIRGAQITILDALLKMRQACCDPRLLKDAARTEDSAKRDRLLEMLEALVQEGRRILVFSQFVEMLRLIEADVVARGWSHEWLSGDTVDRDGAVTRFQQGAASIFLISLKAGGVGLTLTAADTVILYDPWWNPAVERQAMDRAHRIGQTRAVFVYRLVAEGTVEEAILALQARKQALADALFEGGPAPGAPLDMDTITDLFRPLSPTPPARWQ